MNKPQLSPLIREEAMSDLKPCPFCGATPDIGVFPESDDSPRGYFCKCPACLAETAMSSDRSTAIAAWNRRAPLQNAAPSEAGWLIERDGPDGLWFYMATRWARDASMALRFARREDAHVFAQAHLESLYQSVVQPPYRITEHRWL